MERIRTRNEIDKSLISLANPLDHEQTKDEMDIHPVCKYLRCSITTVVEGNIPRHLDRPLTRPLSSYRPNNPSRSGSHPSSESSCTTQIVYPSTETPSSPITSAYGFPPLLSPWQLQVSSKVPPAADQTSSTSSNSERAQGYSYEVVV